MLKTLDGISILITCTFLYLTVDMIVIKRKLVYRKHIGHCFFIGYVCGIVRKTLWGRKVIPAPWFNLELFWSYRESIARDGILLRISSPWLFKQIILNILLFVPLGALLAFIWPETYYSVGLRKGALRVMGVACMSSIVLELIQGLMHIGLCEIDDVINNVLGAVLGYLLYRFTVRITMGFRQQRGKHFA